ncbi:molybdopterin-dependent oxidoreductase [Nitrospirota bacterium]
MIKLRINDREIELQRPMTVLEAARANGIMIPHFCDHPLLEKFAGCRMCLVEIEGARGLQTSCTARAADGMVVRTETPDVTKARKAVMELFLINHPLDCPTCDKAGECKLQDYSVMYGPEAGRFEETKFIEPESTRDPLIVRNMERCIMCTRCVRACAEVQGASAISVVGRGKHSFIEPFSGKRFDCDYCGLCITVCPVGSLMSALHRHNYRPWETTSTVDTICPFCGVGCSVTLQMRGNTIQRTKPKYRAGVNEGTLCARGYFGYEFPESPRRLTSPLIRREGKLVPATYEEALSYTYDKLINASRDHGPSSVAAIASARCSNEDNYMLQRFFRGALGSDNIDSIARLGLLAARTVMDSLLGPGSTASPLYGIRNSGAVLVLGCDPLTESPVLGVRIRNARRSGAEVVVLGSSPGLLNHTTIQVGVRPGTEGHVLSVLLSEISSRTRPRSRNEEIEKVAASLTCPSADEIGSCCDAKAVEKAASILADTTGTVSIVIGRDLAAREHGDRNLVLAAALAHYLDALVYLCSEGPNENGLLDMGCAPGLLPGGVDLNDPEAREKYAEAYGRPLPEKAGITLMEFMEGAASGEIKAMFVMGENPAFNLPDSSAMTEALDNLEFLAVQDIFMTETAELADVVLPARGWPEKDGTFVNLERRIQVLRKAITREGSMEDWRILGELCRLAGMNDGPDSSEDVMREVSGLSPLHRRLSHENLKAGADMFPYNGKTAKSATSLNEELLAKAAILPPLPDEIELQPELYRPLFHSGTLSRSSKALNSIMPEPMAIVNPSTASIYGLSEGDSAIASSGRGQLRAIIHIDKSVPDKVVFISNNFKGSGLLTLLGYNINPITKTPYTEAAPITLKKGG